MKAPPVTLSIFKTVSLLCGSTLTTLKLGFGHWYTTEDMSIAEIPDLLDSVCVHLLSLVCLDLSIRCDRNLDAETPELTTEEEEAMLLSFWESTNPLADVYLRVRQSVGSGTLNDVGTLILVRRLIMRENWFKEHASRNTLIVNLDQSDRFFEPIRVPLKYYE